MIHQLEKNSMRRDNGCIEWISYRNDQGYGRVRYKGKVKYAHRLSAELYLSDFTPDLDVLHRCDRPSCINPEHLYMGTDSDNQKDAVKRGRHVTKKTSLSKEEMEDIRGYYALGFNGYQIANMVGYEATTIYRILRREGCYSE